MPRIGRPIFRRTYQYVAIRRIKAASNSFIEPGESVMHLRQHQLRDLYRRRRIGPVGHPWTAQALASKGFPVAWVKDVPPVEGPIEPVHDKRPWAVLGTQERFATKKEAVTWAEANAEPGQTIEVEKDGLVWAIPGRDERFKTKTEASEWIAEHLSEPEEGRAPEPEPKEDGPGDAAPGDESDPDGDTKR